jgi:glutamine amidotransferase
LIAIIDYGSGNLRSIQRSVSNFYRDVYITRDLNVIERSKAIILPGVGAYGDAIRELKQLGLFNYLKSRIQEIPTLGICLGMQLLLSNSQESIGIEGLNIFPGNVIKLEKLPSIRIPHTGWNRLIPISKPYFFGYVYFNHSFYCMPEDRKIIVAEVFHGQSIPVIISKGNVIGTQFHPEKSKVAGNEVLNYFVSLIRGK